MLTCLHRLYFWTRMASVRTGRHTRDTHVGVFSHVWGPSPQPPTPSPVWENSEFKVRLAGPLSLSVSKYLLSNKSRRDSTENRSRASVDTCIYIWAT